MGEIQLPIPMSYQGKSIGEISISPLTGSVIADTKKIMDEGMAYEAMRIMVAGCTESIGEATDRPQIREILRRMTYKSAEYVLIKILTLEQNDNKIEGSYPCPHPACGGKVLCQFNEDESLDTSDDISDLEVVRAGENESSFDYDLLDPVTIETGDGEEPINVSSVAINFPTLNDCSMALRKRGQNDHVRLQMGIYQEALTKVGGHEVDTKWKNRYGLRMFEKMKGPDLRALSKEVDKYGLKTELEKHCLKCGTMFHVELDTANFFASALRSH